MGEAQSKQIGNAVFTITPIPAMKSFTLQSRLAPALAEIAGMIGSLSDFGMAAVDEIAPMIGKFFSKLPPSEMEFIVRELLDGALMAENGVMVPLFSPHGSPQGDFFNVKMQGRTMDIWKLLWFSLEVNYPDFFSLLGGKGAAKKAELRSVE